MVKFRFQLRQASEKVLFIQPLFAIPVYFSVLLGTPPIWSGLVIALIPLGIRFWLKRRLIDRTPFDLPILLFLVGCLVGIFVAPDKTVALAAFSTTIGSALIYYGLTGNGTASNRYWINVSGIIGLLILAATIWFLSQGNGREYAFNKWAFQLFRWLPRTDITLQMHGLGSVLAVVVPPLIAGAIFSRLKWLRLLYLVAGLFFLFCLVLSDSGTGWLATIFGLAFVFLAWRLWTIAVMIPAAALITALILDVYSKFASLSQSLSTIKLLERVHIWANTLPLFTGKYIFVGLGLGSWYDKYQVQYGITVQHIHNNYLQIYADCGILGVLAMVVAYVIFVQLTIRIVTASKNNAWYGPAVGLAGGIVAGAFFAFLDVTTNGIVILDNHFMYLSIPVLWIWAALLVTAQKKLSVPPMHG